MQRSTDTEPSDEEVIRRVSLGAKEDFRILVERHERTVYSMIMRQVGEAVIANELAQDTFIKAYLNLKSFRGEARFSTWLTTIALNVTRSYFTSARFKERQKSVVLSRELLTSLASEVSDTAEFEHLFSQLQVALGTLKPLYREVVVLCRLEKKSYEEAAEILGVPVGTISSRINTAIHLLREAFQNS